MKDIVRFTLFRIVSFRLAHIIRGHAGEIVVRLRDLSGAVLSEERKPVEVAPLANRPAMSIEREKMLAGRDPTAVFLQVELLVAGQPVASNLRFFVPPKQLALEKPQIAAAVSQSGGLLRVRLSSDVFARHVRLGYDADDGFFEDNYFDLLPGAAVEVTYRPKGDVSPEAFKRGLSIMSLVDAF